MCFNITNLGNCKFGGGCSYQYKPVQTAVIIEVKENMVEVTKRKAELQKIVAQNKVRQDLLIFSQQTLDLLNKEFNILKVDIDRIEKDKSSKDDVINQLKDKVSISDTLY